MYRMSKCVHIVKNNEIVVAFNDYNFKVIDLDKDLYSVVESVSDFMSCHQIAHIS